MFAFVVCLFQLLGRLFDRVDLIKPVSNVRPSVCLSIQTLEVDLILWVANFRPSVRLYVRPSTKSFFDFDEIWYTGSTR